MKVNPQDIDVIGSYIAAVNRHDVVGLGDLMTEDHTFIDSLGRSVSGRKDMIEAWTMYFAMFPDYQIRVDSTLGEGGTVAVFGSASGTYNGKRGLVAANRISMEAAWRAIVVDGKVKIWQVYCDWTKGMHTIDEDEKNG